MKEVLDVSINYIFQKESTLSNLQHFLKWKMVERLDGSPDIMLYPLLLTSYFYE